MAPSYSLLQLLLVTTAPLGTHSLAANSWQSRIDKALLDLDTKPQARFRLLQRAFQDPKLLEDVTSAVEVVREKGFGKGHPEAINTLWPEGTVARADLEGLAALQKQVPELVKSFQEQAPTLLSSGNGGATVKPPSIEAGDLIDGLVSLATDSKKQEELKEEAKNALRATPKGLETPDYKVVRTLEGPIKLGRPELIEIREYEPFTVARTTMGDGSSDQVFGTSAGGTGFNALAGYLFGRNEEKASMAMTMPVEISKGDRFDAVATMSFVLPKAADDMGSEAAPPAPLAGDDVTIEKVPGRLVAVKPFAGIVTDEEVERQREALLAALEASEEVDTAVVNPSEVSVLQYNAPYTIPWRRRNEVAIVVEQLGGAAAGAAGEPAEAGGRNNAWYDAEGDRGSWFDAGVRLTNPWFDAEGDRGSWYDAGVRMK